LEEKYAYPHRLAYVADYVWVQVFHLSRDVCGRFGGFDYMFMSTTQGL